MHGQINLADYNYPGGDLDLHNLIEKLHREDQEGMVNTSKNIMEAHRPEKRRELSDKDIEDMGTYHPPEIPAQVQAYANINHAFKNFARAIRDNAPDSADRIVAIRTAREARMWANAAIALDGRF